MVKEIYHKLNLNDLKQICENISHTKLTKVELIMIDKQSFKIICRTKHLIFEINNHEIYKYLSPNKFCISRVFEVMEKKYFPFTKKKFYYITIKQKNLNVEIKKYPDLN
jgi:hypothetical protein